MSVAPSTAPLASPIVVCEARKVWTQYGNTIIHRNLDLQAYQG
jgi:ABC-type transporter Mla maintaining outer membrane lipid asymmetry ATPase subunit MlaF